MSKAILRAANIQKTYKLGRVPLHVLRGVSITVQRGEFLAIMGSSGSGKSTLLHILGALDTPDKGEVVFEGTNLFEQSSGRRDILRNATFGFVFQFYHLLPELNVLENTVLPGMVKHSMWSWPGKSADIRQNARNMLTRFGLGERLKHRPNELSGGERQRVAIARALANQPQVLLADEPTGNLDAATGREIIDVLKRLNTDGQTIVMVTHDPQVAAAAHRVIHLADGRIAGASPGPTPPTTNRDL